MSVAQIAKKENGWDPKAGAETSQLVEAEILPPESKDTIIAEATSVLSHCVAPSQPNQQKTGLVVGYVQSGKTLSFTTVTALARDNGYQAVIVVAGTSTPLYDQSTARLRKDLQLEKYKRWVFLREPENDETTKQSIQNALRDWEDQSIPIEQKRTVLITVKKNHIRLNNLNGLLKSLDLKSVPVLIVDDEGDQASLNTKAKEDKEASTTYKRLMEMKGLLPKHTFLQYTATPQAPLLISIIDSLSPKFVEVITPGQAYVGGKEFFTGNHELVRIIPPDQVPTKQETLTAPPETLIEALQVFMVGVAVGLIHGEQINSHRSMMVHPSRITIDHHQFFLWVKELFDDWKAILELGDSSSDKKELLEDFLNAYGDLRETVPSLPSFDDVKAALPRAFNNTIYKEVNSFPGQVKKGKTPEIDWSQSYGWILVGGQAMDRGFTVEGLTVTYMPRGVGVGNADTVQQRARFFGYKKQYLGYCRVYLEEGSLAAFESYVEHEEFIRQQLKEYQESGQPLDEWKRAFILSPKLKPCRSSVLKFDYMRGNLSDTWFYPRTATLENTVIQSNRQACHSFVNELEFIEDEGHPERQPIQKHLVSYDVPLKTVLEDLLVQYRIIGHGDLKKYTGMMLQLSAALDKNPDETASVYLMSGGEVRKRGINDKEEIKNLFQGAYPVTPVSKRGEIYGGDTTVKQYDEVSIQIHRLQLESDDGVVTPDVPVIAVWVPKRLSKAWISQEQGSD